LTDNFAIVKVTERIKGAVASGSQLRLSWFSQGSCSNTPVELGQCGSPVDYTAITIGDNAANVEQTITRSTSYEKQIISVHAPMLYPTSYFNNDVATGMFELMYGTESTGPMSITASAQSIRSHLEHLDSVNVVEVSESISSALVLGVSVKVAKYDQNIQVTGMLEGTLLGCEKIKVGRDGEWYSILESYDGLSSLIPLALFDNCGIATSFLETDTADDMYRWDRGKRWDVFFVSTADQNPKPLSVQVYMIAPSNAFISVRPQDCKKCQTVEGLQVLKKYWISQKDCNSRGCGDFVMITAWPNQIPLAPSTITAQAVSGAEIDVYVYPPNGDNDITSYVIQWSLNSNFENAVDTGSCTTVGFGECSISDSNIDASPPYTYRISYLTNQNSYYIRAAARNPISLVTPEEDTNWSDVIIATAVNQVPGAPVSVEVQTSSISSVQVLVEVPTTNGGEAITSYLIECSTESGFDASDIHSQNISNDGFNWLRDNTLVVEIESLAHGANYLCRASAANLIGPGLMTTSLTSATVGYKSDAPFSASLTTVTESLSPIDFAVVSWKNPSSNNGYDVDYYSVEFWETGSVYDSQVVKHYTSDMSNGLGCEFTLCISLTTGVETCTATINSDDSNYTIYSALVNAGWDTENDNATYTTQIGIVSVEKTYVVGLGNEIEIIFQNDDINQGNQPLLYAATSCPVNHEPDETVEVVKKMNGQREGGYSAKQIVNMVTSNSLNDTDLSGYYRFNYEGSLIQTVFLDVQNDDVEVIEDALGQLHTLGRVEVVKNTLSYTGNDMINYAGFQFEITFVGVTGPTSVIGVDFGDLKSNVGEISVTIFEGHVYGSNNIKLAGSHPGEYPKGWAAYHVAPTENSLTVSNLIAGETYLACVRANNKLGASDCKSAGDISLPLQRPGSPTDVSISVHYQSATTLDVTYDKPT
jgi:hypothetical protein